MPELLLEFAEPVADSEGRIFMARAYGAARPDGNWHGWLEFQPTDGGAPMRTARETTQPNRTDVEYWATGLSAVYLEGALNRACVPEVSVTK
jgi:hypothetical protein